MTGRCARTGGSAGNRCLTHRIGRPAQITDALSSILLGTVRPARGGHHDGLVRQAAGQERGAIGRLRPRLALIPAERSLGPILGGSTGREDRVSSVVRVE
mgnify:CR=1 FL=1